MFLLRNMSIVATLGLLVSVATVGVAVVYAIRPNEQRLALMRPLSLAAIFGGLSTFTLGITNVLRGIAENQPFTPGNWGVVAVGAAESAVALFVAFGCLTIAWLLVALGMRRA